MPQNFGQMPPIPPELANNIGDPNYRPTDPTLVPKVMKRIPQVPTKIPLKDDKLADRVAQSNPIVYNGNYDPIVLEEWVRAIQKLFVVVEVPEEKKVNIGT